MIIIQIIQPRSLRFRMDKWCYTCRHWPFANKDHPNRVERCELGKGLTHGFASCNEWSMITSEYQPLNTLIISSKDIFI
jgi:hypothetical protein